MEIRYNDKVCIIAPICANLDKFNTSLVLKKISEESRRIAIDLTYVEGCSIDFIEEIKNFTQSEISIFNIPSDIFALFNFMNVDKFAKIFVSEQDFETDLRQLINRQFKLV